MVNCPVFLNKKRFFFFGNKGLTITELLISVVILGILIVLAIAAFQPMTQLQKARDAQRKADLKNLKNKMEDYYNDHKKYPDYLADLDPDYTDRIPVDPSLHIGYAYYVTNSGKSFLIYANLENSQDPAIAASGCQEGCGSGCAYNYGVTSSDTQLETEGCSTCAGAWWACQRYSGCNNYGPKPTCFPGARSYCDDNSCGGGCTEAKTCTN